ncbi:hypothetical protein [Thermococcus sp.]|uniref:hypothetical protein n=1 Tax=Thermococcus sp. TaxID=35749 RepID=UPI002609473E|nr:hypothetical protein [Thermococcus sp.]
MPSWRVHKKWGEKILSFSSRQIDDMIDYGGIPGLHDAGRYNEGIYHANMKTLEYNYPDELDRAFKYYILHHILDVVEQKLVSYFARSGHNIRQFVIETIKSFEIPWDKENVENVKWEIIEYFENNPSELDELIVDIIKTKKFKRKVYTACKNKYPFIKEMAEASGQRCVQKIERVLQIFER